MNGIKIFVSLLLVYAITISNQYSDSAVFSQDEVEALKSKLTELSLTSSNTYFINHCNSFLSVIDSKKVLTSADINFLTDTYAAFSNPGIDGDPGDLSSYLNRQRPFIISWISPSDGAVSFSWLKLPKDWNPDNAYPLYIELHGLWDVAANPIEYLTYPFRKNASNNFAFEDGYLLSPWGRGNYWYLDISETDIWECMASLEKMVKIDPSRKYLTGHSMGGFGAWNIGIKSVNTWAALGVHAGALWYDSNVMQDEVFEILKEIPVYFVVGDADGLYSVNLLAYQSLQAAGNKNTEFVTFSGGHDYFAENVQNMYLWLREFTNDDWFVALDDSVKVHSSKTGIGCTPNPVRNLAKINFWLETPSELSIDLYDSSGRKVQQLFTGYKTSGEYKLNVDTTDLPSGSYSILLKLNDDVKAIKIVVIK